MNETLITTPSKLQVSKAEILSPRASNSEKIFAILMKNLKIRLRNYQTYIYSFGFPLVFTLLFYFMFGTEEIGGGWVIFDFAIAGMLIYTASFGTINAAMAFTEEKQKGTLTRLDTMPIGRAKIFIATLMSEGIFLVLQLAVMMAIGYGIMGLHWHNDDLGLLLIGFLIMLVFGLSTVGLGIIISAYAKTAESALGIAMMYVLPVIFLSGAMTPFASNVQYFMPPYWAYAVYRQVVILGDDFWTGFVQKSSTNPLNAEYLTIPLWGGAFIILAILFSTIIIGIYLFQRKTLQ